MSNFGECIRCKNTAPIAEEGLCIDCVISGEDGGMSDHAHAEHGTVSNEQSFVNIVNMISEKLSEHTNIAVNKLNSKLVQIEQQNAYIHTLMTDIYNAESINHQNNIGHEKQTIRNAISLNIIWAVMAVAFIAGTLLYFL